MSPLPPPEFDEPRPAPQNVPPVRARQGVLGRPVLMVLVGALVLAAIAWWGAELFGSAIEPPAQQQVGDPQDVQPGTDGNATGSTRP
jgi:hypothetical protein